jgi:hypothetical protein
MRVTTIPDNAIWDGAQRLVIGPPDGDPTGDIRPVEAIVDIPPTGIPRLSVRCALEPGDLEKLTAGGHVWIAFYGHMVPFCIDITEPLPRQEPA